MKIEQFHDAIRRCLDPANNRIQHEGVPNAMYLEDEDGRPEMLHQEDTPDDEDYGDMIVADLPHADDIVDGDEEDGDGRPTCMPPLETYTWERRPKYLNLGYIQRGSLSCPKSRPIELAAPAYHDWVYRGGPGSLHLCIDPGKIFS